jgi:hypothetical protein
LKRKAVAGLLLTVLLASFAVVLTGNLNSVKADDSAPIPTGSNVINSSSGIIVVNVTSAQSFVEEGFPVNLTATVSNTESSSSSFNLTFCANNFPLDTQAVTLAGESSADVTFEWNTTGFALGNYTLSAFAWSVSGETITVYSNFVGGKILVTCPGDLTGHFKVNFLDITAFVSAYLNYFQTGWCNPAIDFCHTEKLDFRDVQLFVNCYLDYYVGPTPFVTASKLALTLNLTQDTYSLGQPVNFTLTINNTSSSPITFERSASTFDFFVYNSTGIVYRYSCDMVFPMWAMMYTLAPGANLTQSFEWNQTCNFMPTGTSWISNPTASPPVFQASPGTYYIVGEALGMQTAPQEITIE